MRRTIKQQPMSLQEITERKEQAEQRIHAADGLVATAEQNHAAITEEYNLLALKLEDLDKEIENREQELSGFEASCKEAEEEKKRLQKDILSLKEEHIIEASKSVDALQKIRDASEYELATQRETLAALVVAKEKQSASIAEAEKEVTIRRAEAQRLSEAARKFQLKIDEMEAQLPSLEQKSAEIDALNQTILERKDAITSISEEYARTTDLLEKQRQLLEEAKTLTLVEGKRVQELHEALAEREAEVTSKLTSLQGVQENLETMRTRMLRAEKDAEAKKFLERGY